MFAAAIMTLPPALYKLCYREICGINPLLSFLESTQHGLAMVFHHHYIYFYSTVVSAGHRRFIIYVSVAVCSTVRPAKIILLDLCQLPHLTFLGNKMKTPHASHGILK